MTSLLVTFGVMGLAAADEKAGQRLGDHRGSGLRAVHVEMAQRLADAAAALHGPGELVRCAAGRDHAPHCTTVSRKVGA